MLDERFAARLHRPFLDLGPLTECPLHIYRCEFAFESFCRASAESANTQRKLPNSYRSLLCRYLRHADYDVEDPRSVAVEVRTERWAILCEALDRFAALSEEQRIPLISLLAALGFNKLICQLLPRVSRAEIAASPATAYLASQRALAAYVISREEPFDYSLDQFKDVALASPMHDLSWRGRVSAGFHLVVQNARHEKNIDGVRAWRGWLATQLAEARPFYDDFDEQLMMSRFYRAVSFLPFMEERREETRREMDLAELHAFAAYPTSFRQEIAKRDNLHPLLESRTKEALWLGDLDVAEERARKLVEVDPLDPRPHVELGEVLAHREAYEAAARSYLNAAMLGPPGTDIALYMAGQCHEALDSPERALDCYMACLDQDPAAISALESVRDLAGKAGITALAGWAASRLEALGSRRPPTPHH